MRLLWPSLRVRDKNQRREGLFNLFLAVPLEETTLYDFQNYNIDGELIDFGEKYRGRVTIVTNVASE